MKRKGLSQILYLIIAASVLMMVAMVITFTATDIIGGAGGQANDAQCNQAVVAKCSANPAASTTTLPDTCIDSEGRLIAGTAYNGPDPSTATSYSAGSDVSSVSGQLYADCSAY